MSWRSGQRWASPSCSGSAWRRTPRRRSLFRVPRAGTRRSRSRSSSTRRERDLRDDRRTGRRSSGRGWLGRDSLGWHRGWAADGRARRRGRARVVADLGCRWRRPRARRPRPCPRAGNAAAARADTRRDLGFGWARCGERRNQRRPESDGPRSRCAVCVRVDLELRHPAVAPLRGRRHPGCRNRVRRREDYPACRNRLLPAVPPRPVGGQPLRYFFGFGA